MRNFKVIKSDNVFFGAGIHIEHCTLECNNCRNDFITTRRTNWDIDDGSNMKVNYAYNYCPYCGIKLEVEDEK